MDASEALYSPTTEETVIGRLLIDPSEIREIDLSPDDFYINRWGLVYSIMRQQEAPDMLTICAELDRRGKLAEVGGAVELTRLITSDFATGFSSGYTHDLSGYAAIIREKAGRRRVLRQAQALAQAAMNQERPLEETMGAILTEIATSTGSKGAQHWGKFLAQADAEIEERRANPQKVWGMATGFREFDYITGGLQETELLLLTADPGLGKSIFIMQLAAQLAEGGYPGAFYSLEMTGRAVARRALSAKSSVKSRILKSGIGWTEEEYSAYYQALDHLTSLPVFMADDSGWHTGRLQSDLARLKRVEDIRWFAVDYSFMLTDGEGKLNEIERTALVVNRLKVICKSLELAAVVIHPKNKAGMSGDNSALPGLRGSGQVGYDTDLALFMSNPDEQNPAWVRLTFGKGRELDNPKGHFDLVRLPGLPWYQAVQSETTNLTDKVNGNGKVKK